MAGATYVIGTWDNNELRRLQNENFAKLRWNPACRLIVVNGPNGKLVIRFGVLDNSGKFIRLKEPLKQPVHVSVALLRATIHDPADFILENLSNPVRRARKIAKGIERVGLIIGDETKNYSSLLSIEGDTLFSTDVEPRVAGSTGAEATVVREVEEAEAERVRQYFKAELTNARFLSENPRTTNTQVKFTDGT